jgi:isocitrate dehydrogenase
MTNTRVTVAYGDGIGPEIMAAVLHVLDAAGAQLELESVEIGEKVYLRGQRDGIGDEAWESLRRTRVFLKSPIAIPASGEFRSLNVAARKTLGLYANVRPCVAYDPFIETTHPGMNVVIIRENEEDLYAGIEYRISPEVVEGLKLISRPGCERIVRYAFEYARRHNRRKVSCFTKDNILPMTDGLFHRVFDEIAADYPDIAHEHWIVDLGAAKLADTPEAFDVVVLPNLYGDILSEVTAQLTGSVGLAGSANIGELCAMFEGVQGPAPRLAGKNLANPSGLLLAAVLMLVHVGQPKVAERVHNAWLRTIEDGIHTYDIHTDGVSTVKAGTKEFADAVAARLGKDPIQLEPVRYTEAGNQAPAPIRRAAAAAPRMELRGIDVYVEWPSRQPNRLGDLLRAMATDGLELQLLSNRGVKVWPEGAAETFCTDSFRCRFLARADAPATHGQVIDLLQRLHAGGIVVTKTEYLRTFDGQAGYSLAQGE